ncbi:MotA/TolQ/ExbB proton channel family protein [Desulfuromonas acetoxidans]|uniref:MotA/TolQ/ExbB proton channel n=1 Tax=Desulfuromonas acetoxidans (strain DSM 684 / 11070) TaxID=281689 RepID=Q1JX29_DESA6|nr:MotA/TolQ/ExbB proton channel family protein [Desulfuromonas acetoxidans]EAT14833.1 MotA/TolQ/ExbB proton channel [Desulfuromonas acetoxidans DSM 684]MBF0646581.1 MotA/TolQ/ExbB proton channel family protein [Desulfuromonas acetoxidans]NVD26103.1 MotA/TolQ/ExbB proton channel family protein [Desulfuromonas acetoxidans]NVE17921.1 MotA/TolQ/ExbB proton channel family protein [Desulfuromonas acetoxidans]
MNIAIKRLILFVAPLMALLMVMSVAQPLWAADIRAAYQQLQEQLNEQQQRQQQTARTIADERRDLKQELSAKQRAVRQLEQRIATTERTLAKAEKALSALQARQSRDHEAMNNLAAAVRVAAKQLQERLDASCFSALQPQRARALNKIFNKHYFPGLNDFDTMKRLYLEDMTQSSQVQLAQTQFTALSGIQETGPVLLVGPFLAVAAEHECPALLHYHPASHEFSIINASLSWTQRKLLNVYLAGKSDLAPLDLKAGAGLAQLTEKKTFWQRIKGGGVLVWPILLLAVIAVLISIERALFLKKVHDNTDRTMNQVNEYAEQDDWEACQKLIEGRSTPVYNVVRAGISARHEEREILESILQEAILKELPRLERALPLLNIMAAIAPLLGLLGTVTGMISTFEIINIYGTGDPRMMSGGISVALVTTMLGLVVAIPIMLLHTFLNRQVEHIIGDMEEKSVALTNIISRCQG